MYVTFTERVLVCPPRLQDWNWASPSMCSPWAGTCQPAAGMFAPLLGAFAPLLGACLPPVAAPPARNYSQSVTGSAAWPRAPGQIQSPKPVLFILQQGTWESLDLFARYRVVARLHQRH
eukprot:1734943-Rhodomonas_salina.1